MDKLIVAQKEGDSPIVCYPCITDYIKVGIECIPRGLDFWIVDRDSFLKTIENKKDGEWSLDRELLGTPYGIGNQIPFEEI